MREIKFRAWNTDSEKMESFRYLCETIEFTDVFFGHYINLELMQYTGLKDKYGNEIYDGDYIRYSMRTVNGSVFTHVCRVFQHESGTWRIEGYHEDNHSYETKGTVYAAHLICEVIGNIYENPELAK